MLPLLATVECATPVNYVLRGRFNAPDLVTYSSGAEIPDLGRARHESSVRCDSYLVVLKERAVLARSVRQNDGAVRYLVDSLRNLAAVSFSPGGRWGEDVLLHGVLAGSDHPECQAVMKSFAVYVRKSFSRIAAYWVGNYAEAMLEDRKSVV